MFYMQANVHLLILLIVVWQVNASELASMKAHFPDVTVENDGRREGGENGNWKVSGNFPNQEDFYAFIKNKVQAAVAESKAGGDADDSIFNLDDAPAFDLLFARKRDVFAAQVRGPQH